MRHGHYKLEEVLLSFEQLHEEVRRIAVFKKRREKVWYPSMCTQFDMGLWLKTVPERTAYQLGWKLLPAFEALVYDKVAARDVDSLRPWLTAAVGRLLQDLEIARQDIRLGIGREYTRMKLGDPMIEPLLQRAIWLTEEALSLTPSLRTCA